MQWHPAISKNICKIYIVKLLLFLQIPHDGAIPVLRGHVTKRTQIINS